MSIFNNIINEGEQADIYRVRKAKEAEDAKKANEGRHKAQSFGYYGNKMNILRNPNINDRNSDLDRANKTIDISHKELDRRIKNVQNGGRLSQVKNYDSAQAMDSINRHIRRHPRQYAENTIFQNINII